MTTDTRTGGRRMGLTYRGQHIEVREGYDGSLEFRRGRTQVEIVAPKSKSFEAATNEARKWLLEFAGEMKGDYSR